MPKTDIGMPLFLLLTKIQESRYSERMNWQTIIRDLLESGMTQVELAKELEVSQAFIHDIYAGKRAGDPQWRHGQQLIALHKRRCKKRAAA